MIDQSQSFTGHVYFAKWLDDNEFIVKQAFDYLEVHYHLKITQLRIPNILPLLSLYKDEKSDDLWMFFPKYFQKLNEMKLTVDHLVEISYDIADTLGHLHFHEIVHGDVRVENILLDNNNQCYLAKFCWDKEKQSGITEDIYAYGQVAKFLYEGIMDNGVKTVIDEDLTDLNDFKILFTKCLSLNMKKRPKAVEIVQQLEEIRKNL